MESTPASVSCANTCETTTPFKTTYEPLNPTHIILMATSIQSFVRSLGPSALPVPPTNNEQQQQASSTITHKWLPASNNCDNSPSQFHRAVPGPRLEAQVDVDRGVQVGLSGDSRFQTPEESRSRGVIWGNIQGLHVRKIKGTYIPTYVEIL
ncbi:hypothetical protein QR685DRAFT_206170 [Neurospora intermedia]|uniref:Uncharacterized protein n=1 Tax=Neurospora intermedia TaxID=5142 RepID=A0ABR3DFQ6_NEUIN